MEPARQVLDIQGQLYLCSCSTRGKPASQVNFILVAVFLFLFFLLSSTRCDHSRSAVLSSTNHKANNGSGDNSDGR